MKLSQLLSTLITTSVIVVLKDVSTSNIIAEIKSEGYTALDNTIESREVMNWNIVSASKIEIALGEVIE